MGQATPPQHLVALLSNPHTPADYAADALEEWIAHRRAKGDSLFHISLALAHLEDITPPHTAHVLDRARYLTNVPQPQDLTPPVGLFPLARSASIATILNHLLATPPPSIQHSREVVLEYVLSREAKLKEKKPGRAGKGTLGREAFEDIAKRMGELEDSLRGNSASSPSTSPSRDAYPSPRDSPRQLQAQLLNENQQIGLTLILSLRMSLSYFTLQELANQLMLVALGDAERVLIQHIRRRISGEGRWGVGKELEYVERLTLSRRPALRPAFRSAKARTLLPPEPLYPIQLPAPSKSQCIKQIQALAKEIEAGGPAAGQEFLHVHAPSGIPAPMFNTPNSEKHFLGRRSANTSPTVKATLAREGSPQTPLSNLPPALDSPVGSPARTSQPDPNMLANFTMELISEYITREKREQMLKFKWAKSGRAQVSKDLGEIEAALCLVSKSKASSIAPLLLPTFLLLRRTFALPPSPLSQAITEPYIDILPAPPDPDDVPFREPTVSSTTAALYVNPRLSDDKAYDALEELAEFEKEKVDGAGGTRQQMTDWALSQIEAVQKRFPDGSYSHVFNRMKGNLLQQRRPEEHYQSISFAKSPSIHRRVKSNAAENGSPVAVDPLRAQHTRSLSMPDRKASYDSDSDSEEDGHENASVIQSSPPTDQPSLPTTTAVSPSKPLPRVETSVPQLPPLMLTPGNGGDRRSSAASAGAAPSSGGGGGGWWDVVSAVAKEDSNSNRAPWDTPPEKRSSGRMSHMSQLSTTSSHRDSLTLSVNEPARNIVAAPLPPGAEPAQALDFTRPMMNIDLNDSPVSQAKPPFSAPVSPRREVQYLPGQNVRSAGATGSFAPSSPPYGYVPQRKDEDENLPPPPPLRFDQSRSGLTLGSSTTPSNHSSSFTTESTPTPTAFSSSVLSQGISYPAPSNPSLAAATAATPPIPHPAQTPASSSSSTTKSKLGSFGRSMSLAHRKSRKEKEKDGEKEGKDKSNKKEKVLNDPGKWNRDLVANIMGPPAR
ncbi:hypothetical protein I311_02124 [Cryptococcus gattii NT-10]|nr:hypothetical protein I311_02124 [Cryptococcus gattii NT-10]